MGGAAHASATMSTLLRAALALGWLLSAACGPDVEPPEPSEPLVPKTRASGGEEEPPVEPEAREDER